MKFIDGLKLFFLIADFFTIYSCTPDHTSVNKSKFLTEKASGIMVKISEKSEMLLLTDHPPNLETLLRCFLQDDTPNDVFFVRWHLSNLPTRINSDTFHLRISGNVKNELALTLNDLKTKFKSYTIKALPGWCEGEESKS